MRLLFTIHVIITLLMSKPATSQSCDDVTGLRAINCPRENMYFRNVHLLEGQWKGRCCELDDPSYANHTVKCLDKEAHPR